MLDTTKSNKKVRGIIPAQKQLTEPHTKMLYKQIKKSY